VSPLALKWLWIAGGACLVAAVLAFGLAPAGAAPSTGLGDLADHALAFLTLTLWFAGLVRPPLLALLALALIAFGVWIEWLQHAMGLGRVADSRDVAANLAGVAVGLAAARAGLGRWMLWVEARLPRR
jgi:hypothetical protein